jgi:hypothetical protein
MWFWCRQKDAYKKMEGGTLLQRIIEAIRKGQTYWPKSKWVVLCWDYLEERKGAFEAEKKPTFNERKALMPKKII